MSERIVKVRLVWDTDAYSQALVEARAFAATKPSRKKLLAYRKKVRAYLLSLVRVERRA